jgi:hypothetical protein
VADALLCAEAALLMLLAPQGRAWVGAEGPAEWEELLAQA